MKNHHMKRLEVNKTQRVMQTLTVQFRSILILVGLVLMSINWAEAGKGSDKISKGFNPGNQYDSGYFQIKWKSKQSKINLYF